MPSKRGQKAAAASTAGGVDTNGKQYNSIADLWTEELAPLPATTSPTPKRPLSPTPSPAPSLPLPSPSPPSPSSSSKRVKGWYDKGAAYWETQPSSLDGVLGGFGHLSPIDVRDSRAFLLSLPSVPLTSTIDCGAGIGRVAGDLLCPLFQAVDLVEQNPAYVATARERLLPASHPTFRNFYTSGLQDHVFPPAEYGVVWVQWVVSHLTDDDLVHFIQRAVQGVKEGGYVVFKENTAKEGFVMDRDDGSVTRSDSLFKALFARAGMRVVRQGTQAGFPKGLFTVRMYALQPMKEGEEKKEEGKDEVKASDAEMDDTGRGAPHVNGGSDRQLRSRKATQ